MDRAQNQGDRLPAAMLSALLSQRTACHSLPLQARDLGAALYGLPQGQKYWQAAFAANTRPVLVVVPNEQEAAAMQQNLAALLGREVVLLPTRVPSAFPADAVNRNIIGQRVRALYALQQGQPVVACIEAVQTALCPPQALAQAGIRLRVGQELPPDQLLAALLAAGYSPETQAEAPGQCARRAGIIDCVDPVSGMGIRVSYFDDEIDSLRQYDPATQRTLTMLQQAEIMPACECPADAQRLEQAIARLRQATATQIRRLARGDKAAGKEKKASRTDALPWEEEPAVEGQPGEAAKKLLQSMQTGQDAGAVLQQRIDQLIDRLQAGGGAASQELLPFFYPQPATLLDYLHPDALLILDEPASLLQTANHHYGQYQQLLAQALEQGVALPKQADNLIEAEALFAAINQRAWLSMLTLPRSVRALPPRQSLQLQGNPMFNFHGRLEVLAGEIAAWKAKGYSLLIAAGSQQRAEHLLSQLQDVGVEGWVGLPQRGPQPGEVVVLPLALTQGFVSDSWKLCVITGNEVAGAQKQAAAPRKKARTAEENRRIFADLTAGDYVVHERHGIARFVGMVSEPAAGIMREYMLLEYRGGDRLYVPTEQLDLVRRYIGGGEDHVPVLSVMGGSQWQRTRQATRNAARKVAEGLVELYAKRQTSPGFAFSPDTPWQAEFEQRFAFEETPDQLQCIQEIKQDMQRPHPMDRLLCGDVGYGKTEVAMRAAFKAVQDGRQVAVLVPTTLLCQQHYLTFCERMEGYPINLEMLCRFRTAAQQKQIKQRLKDGQIDIIIGTHALLAGDVAFSNLGLLIIDEEQRFGVNHKEKLKKLRENVDVLTLTATPIPRTLHMSLVGIRDLSVIDTPPQDRLPVQTLVVEYDDGLVRDAILREIGRGGQVYFLYNRVAGIDRLAEHLRQLVPQARVVVGHGQMDQRALEEVMLQFVRHEADILLSTTIIENGLDVPAANTLIVCDADRLGLAQLYQLRGRVGRSNRMAYAYLTYRPGRTPSEEAHKRLQAIREFTQLGAGYRIAMRDLEIRGAGNLLGAEQSGQIAAVGYDLYCKMVEQEVRRLQGDPQQAAAECTLDIQVDAVIPESYIADPRRRLAMYRRLAQVRSESDITDAVDELLDRYGDPPECVLALCTLARLRWLGQCCCLQAISQEAGNMTLRFLPQAEMDVQHLLDCIGQTPNARLFPGKTGGSTRVILQFDRRADQGEMLQQTTAFLQKLAGNGSAAATEKA